MKAYLFSTLLLGLTASICCIIATRYNCMTKVRQMIPSSGLPLSIFHIIMAIVFINGYPSIIDTLADNVWILWVITLTMVFQTATMFYIILGNLPALKAYWREGHHAPF